MTTTPSTSGIREGSLFSELTPHRGRAAFVVGGDNYAGEAEFFVPAGGSAVVEVRGLDGEPAQDFGADLLMVGDGPLGPFRLECQQVYVTPQTKRAKSGSASCLVAPINGPVLVTYGDDLRAPVAIRIALNNFNYMYGDPVHENGGFTRVGTPLVVSASGRRLTFAHTPRHLEVLSLLKAGVLSQAPITECGFSLNADEPDDEVVALGLDVASLCTFAAGGGVSGAMFDWLDETGGCVRRLVPQPVTSRFRRNDIIEDWRLPDFFDATFAEFRRMKARHPAWRRLAAHCGALEDAPFLEQKLASLIMALEFFMRNCLLECGHPSTWVSRLDFTELIGAARKHLAWEVPKHYVTRDTIRLVRNAVMHGGELPTKDSTELRLLFDKWRLFLFRRTLMRLGYRGSVVSPHKGWRASSPVADFSEECNSYTPADPGSDPLSDLRRRLKQNGRRASILPRVP